MSNKQETSYTNKIKNNFVTLTIPNYIRGSKEAASTELESNDLVARRRQRDELSKTRADNYTTYQQAQEELDHFQSKVHEFRRANNIKNPTSDEREVIATVTRSVSSIRLSGPSHGVPDVERRIAGHATALAKRRDETMAAWNDAGKVFLKNTERITTYFVLEI